MSARRAKGRASSLPRRSFAATSIACPDIEALFVGADERNERLLIQRRQLLAEHTLGEFCNGGGFKQGSKWELNSQRLADASHQACANERVAAELEEVIEHADS